MKQDFHDQPLPPLNLKILNSIRLRTKLSSDENINFENLKSGHIGELRFYDFMKTKISTNCIVLNSLRLRSNNSEFQLDSLLFCQNTLYLFEVKNFEGDFYIDRNNWYVLPSRKEINNPLIQLKRSESLLRQLIQHLGYNIQLESYIVFINPEFTLFQAPIHLPIILPSQLNRFFNKIIAHRINPTEKQNELANLLMTKHIEKSVYDRKPKYRYEDLQKGIICNSCSGFLAYYSQTRLKCNRCGNFDRIDTAVLRNIKEYNLLFPNKKITTNYIHEWCSVIPSNKTIRRILSKYLIQVKSGRSTHYIFDSKAT